MAGLDAVLVNLAEMAGGAITLKFASITLLLVNATNLLSKSMYSYLQGNRKFARNFLFSALVIIACSFAGLFFILIMWTGTGEKDLVFTGATRYNTLAAIFTSFFLGSIFACCIKRLWEKGLYFKISALVPFSLMIFLLYTNIPETNAYFQHKLKLGYDYSDQLYIRKQLIPYYKNPDSDNRKLIYLDFSEMKEDEMYYRDVIFSSANAWPLWFLGENAKPEDFPELNHNFGDIKSSVVTLDGKQIIRYKGIIYKTENFYTLKLKDKKFTDISGEIHQKLGL